MWSSGSGARPAGYDRAEADLLIRLPAGFPDVAPDMWWFAPAVKLPGGATVQATDLTETYLGQEWQRWSRHFQPGQWRSGLDGLESDLALIWRERPGAREASRDDGPGHLGNHRRPARRAAASRRAGVRDRRGPARRAGHLRRRRRRLLATGIRWCPPESYAEQHQDGLLITSDGDAPALAEAEASSLTALWLHTHPGDGASPRPSRRDKIVDDQLSDLFRLRTRSGRYGSVVIAARDGQLRFTGHLDTGSGSAAIGRLWSVGDQFQLIHHEDHAPPEPDGAFDRNVRAFGGPVQAALGDLTVGIVGCGGTGSAVAEQLARLGVRRFILTDPDTLSASNVTRVYGSTPAGSARGRSMSSAT